jgi:hypothetical protein
MLHSVKYNFDKKLKVGDLAITPEKNDQLIKFFRKEFDDNIRAFRFLLTIWNCLLLFQFTHFSYSLFKFDQCLLP